MQRFSDVSSLRHAYTTLLVAALTGGGTAAVAAPEPGAPGSQQGVQVVSPAQALSQAQSLSSNLATQGNAQNAALNAAQSAALGGPAALLSGGGELASLPPAGTVLGANDPVMRLLEERGFIEPPAERSLLSKVRDRASDLVLNAMNFIGVRYRRGGTSVSEGFDCSGFTRHIFENSVGLLLPRRADEQARAPGLLQIDRNDLKPGDLVFFNTLRRTFSHVGIYVGDGKFIHSPRTGGEVRVEDMRQAYWIKRFNGARRAPQVGTELPRTAP